MSGEGLAGLQGPRPLIPWTEIARGGPPPLRHYQTEAVDAILAALREKPSTLAVLATGLGKTQIFCEVARRWKGRVLVLAHRDELVEQARMRLEDYLGECVGIEKAQSRAHDERVVVGSVQTVYRPRRHQRMLLHGDFDLVVVDEAHHYVAKTYRQAIEAFTGNGRAKLLGVTATPDRADQLALGKLFSSVAYNMGIREGIEGGWLVPISGLRIKVAEVDISGVATTAGDFIRSQLDEAIVKGVEGIVRETLDRFAGRRTIAFFPGKKSAEYACTRFNALRPGCAAVLTDDTDTITRRRIAADFRAGKVEILCNVMIATEGFDAPDAEVMVCARPTKSRALYTQMIGRVTRPHSSVASKLPIEAEAADERRRMIALSDKPTAIVVDFTGNSGRHRLIGPADVLGGKYPPDVVEEVQRQIDEADGEEVDVEEALKEAMERKEREAEIMRAVAAKIRSRVDAIAIPFDAFGIKAEDFAGDDMTMGPPMTPAQRNALQRLGLRPRDMQGLTKAQASRMIKTLVKRREVGLASYRQTALLKRWGIIKPNMTKHEASRAIDYLAAHRWGQSKSFRPETLRRLAGLED